MFLNDDYENGVKFLCDVIVLILRYGVDKMKL